SLAIGYVPRVMPAASSVADWAWGVGAAALLFASLLTHELAHALTARRHGLRVDSITLHLLGGVSQIVGEPPTPREGVLIAAAGPLPSFARVGLAFGARALAGGPSWLHALLGYLGAANALIGTFNLLPGFPLDGGRIVRAVLWAWRGHLAWATRVSSAAGRGCGVVLAGLGVADAVRGDIVAGFWLVMLGVFIYQSAHTAGQLGEVRQRLTPLPVERIGHGERGESRAA